MRAPHLQTSGSTSKTFLSNRVQVLRASLTCGGRTKRAGNALLECCSFCHIAWGRVEKSEFPMWLRWDLKPSTRFHELCLVYYLRPPSYEPPSLMPELLMHPALGKEERGQF